MSGTSDDEYRRGRQSEEEAEPKVGSVYRRLLLIIWTLGTVIALAVFGANVAGALAVVVVMHIFFAGLIWADIRSLRGQGVDWGFSRHLWFSSALVFPFVTLAYCWYVKRVVRRENERRGYGDDEATAEAATEAPTDAGGAESDDGHVAEDSDTDETGSEGTPENDSQADVTDV